MVASGSSHILRRLLFTWLPVLVCWLDGFMKLQCMVVGGVQRCWLGSKVE